MPKLNEQRPRLLTAGYLTLDVIVRDLMTRDFWHAAGGTCGNVSIFASALGVDVSILARVGEDERGGRLLGNLVHAGVDTTRIECVPRLCTPCVVELVRYTREGGHKFTFRCPACGKQLPKGAVVSKRQANIEVESIDRYDAFFFDRATSATVHLAKAAREAGLLVMFEPTSLRRTAWAERAVTLSDIVKVSQRPGNHIEMWIPNRGASTQFIIETLGARGVRVRSRSSSGWRAWQQYPAIAQSCIRDTAGAGDWLTAGLITSLLLQPHAVSVDMMLASMEFAQRLSSISLAFDGPSGALAALGAPVIERVAKGISLLQPSRLLGGLNRPKTSPEPRPTHYCELCLTYAASDDR